jgi:hypothetical protein
LELDRPMRDDEQCEVDAAAGGWRPRGPHDQGRGGEAPGVQIPRQRRVSMDFSPTTWAILAAVVLAAGGGLYMWLHSRA